MRFYSEIRKGYFGFFRIKNLIWNQTLLIDIREKSSH